MATVQQRLTEAEAAYHDLLTGKAVVEFRDQNGEVVRYGQARKGDLAAYIERLKQQLAGGRQTGPMYFGG
jgi:hypothetical protein